MCADCPALEEQAAFVARWNAGVFARRDAAVKDESKVEQEESGRQEGLAL